MVTIRINPSAYMKTKFVLFILTLSLLTNTIWGQEEQKHKFVFLESGIDGIACYSPEKDYIRAVNDPSLVAYSTDKIKALMVLKYIGIKFEYRIIKNSIGLSGGLRYTRMNTSIGRTSYLTNSPDFFYVSFNHDGLNTEFAKVRELSQKVNYLGVPLELTYYPVNPKVIAFYYRAGVSFNVKLSSESDVLFFNDLMKTYRNEVIRVVEKACPYYTTFNLGLGLKVGKSEKPGFFIEAYAPIGVIYPDNSYFVKPLAGGGFRIMARVPIN